MIYPLEAIGISNGCYDIKSTKKLPKTEIGIQFYEIDYKESSIFDKRMIFDKISEIFLNDCLLFETKRGYHFVSFTIQNLETTLINAMEITNELNKMEIEYEVADYGKTNLGYLILRMSDKRDKKTTICKSKKPKFCNVIKLPRIQSEISIRHLRTYKHLDIPDNIINFYLNNCICRRYGLRLIYYQTSQHFDSNQKLRGYP